jgi:legumain
MKAQNIIVLAYDDVATSSSNPFYGKVFNKPSPNTPGVDVRGGVAIDYKGADVTP